MLNGENILCKKKALRLYRNYWVEKFINQMFYFAVVNKLKMRFDVVLWDLMYFYVC